MFQIVYNSCSNTSLTIDRLIDFILTRFKNPIELVSKGRFTLASKTKETPLSSDPVEQEQHLGPKKFTQRSKSKV